MDYFTIRTSEDGDVYIEKLSKHEIEKRLAERYWGNIIIDMVPSDRSVNLLEQAKMYIIKGESITPKSIEVVTRFEV